MQKIASPRELQAEIQALMAFVHASEKPDRQVVASKLNELADRIAGPKCAARLVPIEKAKKGDMVEIEVGTPWPKPSSPKKEKVTGKVVRVKKDGVVTVDVEKSRSNPGGHSNEDVGYVDVRIASRVAGKKVDIKGIKPDHDGDWRDSIQRTRMYAKKHMDKGNLKDSPELKKAWNDHKKLISIVEGLGSKRAADYDRVAGVRKEKIPETEVKAWKEDLRRNKGRYHGPNGLKSGDKYRYQGKDWLIADFDAVSEAPGGATLALVSPDFKENLRWVEVPGAKKTASAPSVGQKDKVKYHGQDDATFKVLRVFATKDDADGPLPKGLLRLIKKGGGAALVEQLPSKGYKVKGDMLVSPDSSMPRHYIRAFGPSGSWDGHPVDLKPAQLKRLHSYKAANGEMVERLVERMTDRTAAAEPYSKLEAKANAVVEACQEVAAAAKKAKGGGNVAIVDNMGIRAHTYEAKFRLFIKALKAAEGFSPKE